MDIGPSWSGVVDSPRQNMWWSQLSHIKKRDYNSQGSVATQSFQSKQFVSQHARLGKTERVVGRLEKSLDELLTYRGIKSTATGRGHKSCIMHARNDTSQLQ